MGKGLWLCILLIGQVTFVQSQDTLTPASSSPKYVHSPKKAGVYSAVLPGLGQAYNKKYWKIPIVFAAIGTSTGFVIYNQRKYSTFKKAYIDHLNDPLLNDEYSVYSTDQLFIIQDTYHDWRDISIMVLAGFYVLNILDAVVDAHFFRYDVSDDLSLRFSPFFQGNTAGIGLGIRFK